MALFIVVHPNEYFPRGTIVDEISPGLVQKAIMRSDPDTGYYSPIGHEGLCVPLRPVRPWTIRIQARGLDKSW